MSSLKRKLVAAAFVVAGAVTAFGETKGGSSIVVVFKDHHQQTISSTDVSRIDVKNDVLVFRRGGREEQIPLSQVTRIEVQEASAEAVAGRSHFIGKWKVGLDGNSPASFQITLDRDGTAHKTIGGRRGTWTFADGEAQISWNDGWHDAIAKVGNKYEKRAYEPGKSFSEKPSNVAEAKRANDQSI